MVNVVWATCDVSDAIIFNWYSCRLSKSRCFCRMIFPLKRSIEKTFIALSSSIWLASSASEPIVSPKLYVRAGFVSTSFAVTAVSTVPTSVPAKERKERIFITEKQEWKQFQSNPIIIKIIHVFVTDDWTDDRMNDTRKKFLNLFACCRDTSSSVPSPGIPIHCRALTLGHWARQSEKKNESPERWVSQHGGELCKKHVIFLFICS